MPSIEIGLSNEMTHIVLERHLADKWGSGLAAVLATPALVAFCEECARLTVDPLLPEGKQTVGTKISLRHLAPTPPGMRVTLKSVLDHIDGRRLCFLIQAWDETEQIGEAEHERFIIDAERFQHRLTRKSAQARNEGKGLV